MSEKSMLFRGSRPGTPKTEGRGGFARTSLGTSVTEGLHREMPLDLYPGYLMKCRHCGRQYHRAVGEPAVCWECEPRLWEARRDGAMNLTPRRFREVRRGRSAREAAERLAAACDGPAARFSRRVLARAARAALYAAGALALVPAVMLAMLAAFPFACVEEARDLARWWRYDRVDAPWRTVAGVLLALALFAFWLWAHLHVAGVR